MTRGIASSCLDGFDLPQEIEIEEYILVDPIQTAVASPLLFANVHAYPIACIFEDLSSLKFNLITHGKS